MSYYINSKLHINEKKKREIISKIIIIILDV